MTYKVRILPQAEADIVQNFHALHELSPQAATGWYRRVRSEIETLTQNPARCAVAPEAKIFQVEIRQLQSGRHPGIYRILFRIVAESHEVHVLTVRHGARKLLEDKEVQRFLES